MSQLLKAALIGAVAFSGQIFAQSKVEAFERLKRSFEDFKQSKSEMNRYQFKAYSKDQSQIESLNLSSKNFDRLYARYKKSDNAYMRYRLARHAFVLNRLEQSRRILQGMSGIKTTPKIENASRYLLGAIALKKNKKEQAQVYFSNLASKPVRSVETDMAILALARLAYDEGDFSRSQELYASVGSSRYESATSMLEYADAASQNNQGGVAREEILLFFHLHGKSPLVLDTGDIIQSGAKKARNFELAADLLEKLKARWLAEKNINAKAFDYFVEHPEKFLELLDLNRKNKGIEHMFSSLMYNFIASDAQLLEVLRFQEEVGDLNHEIRNQEVFLESIQAIKNKNLFYGSSLPYLKVLNAFRKTELEKIKPKKNKDKEVKSTEIVSLMNEIEVFSKKIEEVYKYFYLSSPMLSSNQQRNMLDIYQGLSQLSFNMKEKQSELSAALLKEQFFSRAQDFEKEVSLSSLYRKELKEKGRGTDFTRQLDAFEEKLMAHERELVLVPIEPQTAAISQLRNRFLLRSSQVNRISKSWIQKFLKRKRQEFSAKGARYRLNLGQMYDHAYKKNASPLGSSEDPGRDEPLLISDIVLGSKIFSERFLDEEKKQYLDHYKFRRAADEYAQEMRYLFSFRRNQQDSKLEGRLKERQIKKREFMNLALQNYEGFVTQTSLGIEQPYVKARLGQLYLNLAKELRLQDDQISREDLLPLIDTAETYFQEVVDNYLKFDQLPKLKFMLAYLNLENGDEDKALKQFADLAVRYPYKSIATEVNLRLGEIYFKKRQYGLALNYYQKVMEKGQSSFFDKALYKTAWSQYLMGNYDQSIESFFTLLDFAENEKQEQGTESSFYQFVKEAEDYISFSLFRSGGAPVAKSIFSDLKWPRYGENILLKTAIIFSDRSEFSDSNRVIGLMIKQYPTAQNLPEALKLKLTNIEKELGDHPDVWREKKEALTLISPKSNWYKRNRQNPKLIAQANTLSSTIKYGLGTYYESQSVEENSNDKSLNQASAFYQSVKNKNPELKESYDARYRLGEVFFRQKKYKKAAHEFELTARNNFHAHHFEKAMYLSVVSRERYYSETSKADAPKEDNSPNKKVTELKALARSVDYFYERAKGNPNAENAYLRSAQLFESEGQLEEAQKRYSKLALEAQDESLRKKSLISNMELLIESEKYPEALAFYNNLDQEKAQAPELLKLKSLAAYYEAGDDAQKLLEYESLHEGSSLGGKAIYKAYLVLKRDGQAGEAEKALSKVRTVYADSPEAQSVYLEQALLDESKLDFISAEASYVEVLKGNMKPEQLEGILVNMSHVLLANASTGDSLDRFLRQSQSQESLGASFLWDMYIRSESAVQRQKMRSHMAENFAKNSPEYLAVMSEVFVSECSEASYWTCQKRASVLQKISFESLTQTTAPSVAKALYIWGLKLREQSKNDRIKIKTAAGLQKILKRRLSYFKEMESLSLKTAEIKQPYYLGMSLLNMSLAYQDFATDLNDVAIPREIPASERAGLKTFFDKTSKAQAEKAKIAYDRGIKVVSQRRDVSALVKEAMSEFDSDNLSIVLPVENAPQRVRYYLPLAPKLFVDKDVQSQDVATQKALDLLRQAAAIEQNDGKAQKLKNSLVAKALFVKPNYSWTLYNKAILDLQSGDMLSANQSLNLLEGKFDPKRLRVLKVYQAYRENKAPQVLSYKDARGEEERYLAILQLLNAKKVSQADVAVSAWLTDSSQSNAAKLAKVIVLLEMKKPAMAKEVLRRVLEKEPEVVEALYLKSELPYLFWPAQKSEALMRSAKSDHLVGSFNWSVAAWEVGEVWASKEEMQRVVKNGAGVIPIMSKQWEDMRKLEQP